jgi:hypothetical protein
MGNSTRLSINGGHSELTVPYNNVNFIIHNPNPLTYRCKNKHVNENKNGEVKTYGNTRSESFTKLSDITGHAFSTDAAAVDVSPVTSPLVLPTALSPLVTTAAIGVFVSSSAAVSSVAALRNISPPLLLLHLFPWESSGGANALTVTTEEDVTAMTIAADTMKNFIMVYGGRGGELCGLWFWILVRLQIVT